MTVNIQNVGGAGRSFPPALIKQAHLICLRDEIFQGRAEALGFTIDGPTSKDLDDAIWLEKKGNDYVVHVSIADVASLVEAGSGIDTEAYSRAFTRYYGNYNEPMIPRVLSEGTLSLFEDRLRPTITVSVPVLENLEMGDPDIKLTYLRSKRKLDFRQAEDIIQSKSNNYNLLECALLAQKLLGKRRADGALAIYDIERGIATDEEGRLVSISRDESHISNIIIQEFMILVNKAVAIFMTKSDMPTVYRNHTAKVSAPPVRELASEIDSAINSPVVMNIETLNERINLILNRASYERTLRGHYGLNLPAYLHCTSPIRRYPDLVVQRILHAFLEEKATPYTQIQLDEIVAHVNLEDEQRKDSKAEALKARAFSKAGRAAQTWSIAQLTQLNETDFHKIVKIATESGELREEVKTEIINRINDEKLPPKDLLYLLVRSKSTSLEWIDVKTEVLKWLVQHSPLAVSMLMIACDTEGWTRPEYRTHEIGPEQNKSYVSIAKVSIDGNEYVSEECSASNMKSAEQLASVNLLSKIVDLNTGPLNFVKSHFHNPNAGGKAGDNFKGRLIEAAQKNTSRGWSNPQFETKRTGGAENVPIFTCTASIRIRDKTYSLSPVSAGNIKDAEQLASEELLGKLPSPGIDDEVKTKVVRLIRLRDYISALNELCQSKKLLRPEYTKACAVEGEQGKFKIDVSLEIAGNVRSASGVAADVKSARQEASKELLKLLWPIVFPGDENPFDVT